MLSLYNVYWITPKGELIIILSLDPRYSTKCWELDSFPVSQILGPRPENARYSGLVFFVFAHEVFAWSVPYSWRNNLSNNRLTVPCCFFKIAFGNIWRVPCCFEHELSGSCWRAVPCCFHTIFSDGFLESRRSLYAIVFVGPGFAPCSWHNIFYSRPFCKPPSGHSPAVDWSNSSCVASYK